MTKYIFLRIAWMKNYKGVTKEDIPKGAGSHVANTQDGGEVYNFLSIKGKYYGYARIQLEKNLRIEKFGVSKRDESISNIVVVFFAKNPVIGGQYIVGWYKNATLYRSTQQLDNKLRFKHPFFKTFAKVKNAFLVAEDDRIFQVPEDGPGQTNAWYVGEYHNQKYLQELAAYIDDPNNYVLRKSKRNSGGWQHDAKLRLEIEFAAMKETAKYFENKNYVVKYRHKENLGWDLEATLGKQTLLLEVKGLSGDFVAVDFTPNEYTNSKINKRHYRICIVSNTLNKKRKLEIFYYENPTWKSVGSRTLKVEEIISARFHNNQLR